MMSSELEVLFHGHVLSVRGESFCRVMAECGVSTVIAPISDPLGQTLTRKGTPAQTCNLPATPARARLRDSLRFKIEPVQLRESM